MKFSDVKLLLPSSGYMKTSEVDSRTVIDEIRDASYERNHQSFVGDDRPELHKTLDGKYQVCVEKESTNLFRDSNPETNPQQGDVNDVSFDINDWGIGVMGKVIYADNSTLRRYRNVNTLPSGDYTIFFLIKPDDGNIPLFRGEVGAGSSIANIDFPGLAVDYTVHYKKEIAPGIWHVGGYGEGTEESDGFGVSKFVIYNNVGFEVTQIHVLEGIHMYPTLPILTQGTPVTRLAPDVKLDKTYNTTQGGMFSFVANHVFTDSLSNSRLKLIGATDVVNFIVDTRNSNRVQFRFGGSGELRTFGFPWQPNNTFKTWAYFFYFKAGIYKFAVYNTDTQQIFISSTIDDSANHSEIITDISLSTALPTTVGSVKFEKFSDYSVPNAPPSNEEIKQMMLKEIKGTSIETSEMTII